MGFIKGAVTLTRYRVEDELPEDFRETLKERIESHAFRRLDEDSLEERSSGWVDILDTLQVGFVGDEFSKEPYLALSFRVDTRTVPPRALRQYCREAEEEVKAREDLDFLNKKRREEIRDGVRARLLRRAIPRSNTYDMVWDLTSGMVFFGSTNSKICDEFTEHFFATFDLRLASLHPYSSAWRILEASGSDPSLVEGLRPMRGSGEAPA
jgi:DNA recombination-dependent growth factor C